MSESRRVFSLGVERPGQMYIWHYDEGPLDDGHARVTTLYTGFSAGTELTFFKGTNPYLHGRWDDQYGLFVDDAPSQHFPLPFLGYMEVGRVVESLTDALHVGDIVAMTYGHKTGHTLHPAHEFWMRLPDDLDPILGIYIAQMGPICANGLLHAAADVLPNVAQLGDGVRGRNVLVLGAGVVGLLTALFARAHGAGDVVVADPTAQRLAAARGLGLNTIDSDAVDVARWCKDRWFTPHHQRGADVVFQCRGQAASLQLALRSLRPQGTVIDLAFYQGGADAVRLGEEFHHNGLRIQCAQIGRVPRGLAHLWDRRRLALATIDLLREYGGLLRKHLITDVVPFDDAPRLTADLAERRRHGLQVVFKVAD